MLTRAASIPVFLDFPKYYLLAGPGVPPAPALAPTLARYRLEVPSFQRGISWGETEVGELIETRSSTLGTVILANLPHRENPVLVDGLQRFATGTALLTALYPEVISPTPSDPAAAMHFRRLQADASHYYPVFESNSNALEHHPRNAISSTYGRLLSEVTSLIKEELRSNTVDFAGNIERLFLERQVSVDLYSGFVGPNDLTNTFIDINTQGIALSPIDLFRAHLVDQAIRLSWPVGDIQDTENQFTDTFENRSPAAHLRSLGKRFNALVGEAADVDIVFPNWDKLAKPEVDAFFDFIAGSIDAAYSPGNGYLRELLESGPQTFSAVVLFYLLRASEGAGNPDFLPGGGLVTKADLHLILRATYRRLLDGTIFRVEAAIDGMLRRPARVTASSLAEAINPSSVAGNLAGPPDAGWLEQALRRADPKRARRIFNACLLPSRTSPNAPFDPQVYGRGATAWNVDHLIPQVYVSPAQTGGREALLLPNLAPLPSSVNKSIRNLQCSIKLGSSGAYRASVGDHPYVKWLVDSLPTRSPSRLDQQEYLVPNASPDIGDQRIEALRSLLLPKL
jgi:hypothetical protein